MARRARSSGCRDGPCTTYSPLGSGGLDRSGARLLQPDDPYCRGQRGSGTVTTGSTWGTAQTRITQAAGALTIGSASTPTMQRRAKCVSGN